MNNPLAHKNDEFPLEKMKNFHCKYFYTFKNFNKSCLIARKSSKISLNVNLNVGFTKAFVGHLNGHLMGPLVEVIN
jgi:hypothetical protein